MTGPRQWRRPREEETLRATPGRGTNRPPTETGSRSAPPVHAFLERAQSTAGNAAVSRLIAQRSGCGPGCGCAACGDDRREGPDTSLVQRALASPRFATDPVLTAVDAGTRTLREGDTGPAVRKVQHGIHDSGVRFAGHGVDGEFGEETTRRVRRFQGARTVTGDGAGTVGTSTIRALDALYPAMALPSTAGDPFSVAGVMAVLCQWNSALVADLKNLQVTFVGTLEWADQRFDSGAWVADPMPGGGETAGTRITMPTAGNTNEDVAASLYHEYQHARSPFAYRTKTWEEEEQRVYELETFWSIDRGIATDPSHTTTDPVSGETTADSAGIASSVEEYPGIGGPSPGEVIAKVGSNRVRVRLPSGRVTVRAAVDGDTVPGPRRITGARRRLRDSECRC